MMAHMTPGEEAALNEVMQMLEAEPVESTTSASANPLVSVTNDDNIPTQREKLAILVSTGKSKETIGVQLTHDQVKRLSDKDVQKYSKRYEAYIGNKTTEALVYSFIMLYSKAVGKLVSIDDVKALQETQQGLHHYPGAVNPCWGPCTSLRQISGTSQYCPYHSKTHRV